MAYTVKYQFHYQRTPVRVGPQAVVDVIQENAIPWVKYTTCLDAEIFRVLGPASFAPAKGTQVSGFACGCRLRLLCTVGLISSARQKSTGVRCARPDGATLHRHPVICTDDGIQRAGTNLEENEPSTCWAVCYIYQVKGEMAKESDSRIARLNNLITTASACKVLPADSFGSDEDLKEIGRMTMSFARFEESLALYCEALLLRPEFGGFHQPKPVIERTLTEKLDLYRKLVVAAGVLHSIDTASVETTISRAKEIGEKRHHVIHGYLQTKADGAIVFRNKGNELRAATEVLSLLNVEILRVDESGAEAFRDFYSKLMSSEVTPTETERRLLTAVEKYVDLRKSQVKVHQSEAIFAAAQKDLIEARRRARNSRARLRRARIRVRRELGRIPQEYRELLVKRHTQLQRCAALAETVTRRAGNTGEAQLETAKLRSLDAQLKAFEDREHIEVSDPLKRVMTSYLIDGSKLG